MTTANFTRKANEGDIVEFLEDYPEFGVRKGQRGVVITELDNPAEAYDVEVEDRQGNFVAFAYSVRPEHIANISDYTLLKGIAHLNDGNVFAAISAFVEAIELRASHIGVVSNYIGSIFAEKGDWLKFTFWMRILMEINPAYEHAKTNVAIGYINLGVHFGMQHQFDKSLHFLFRASGITSDPEVNARLRENFAATYFGLGIAAHVRREFDKARDLMRAACSYSSTDKTRQNLAAACIYAAHHYIEAGQFEQAIDAYDEAMEARSLDADSLNTYAVCLVHVNRLDEARWGFQRALALAPNDPIIRSNLEKLERESMSPEQATNIEEFRYEARKYGFVPIELLAQSYQHAAAGL
ncbi:MAG TPA: tetratricopeptide repeat protein [Pyrinomonadaceae bacterium]